VAHCSRCLGGRSLDWDSACIQPLTVNRAREPAVNLALYWALKWSAVNPTFRCYFRGRVYGTENVPRSGPVVIVSNHASYFDPPLLSCCIRRPVAFMAKAELFEVPLLSQGIRLYGAYPVKRAAADRSAIRAAVGALQQGWAAGIFLPGHRTPDGRIPEAKLGAAAIAHKAQAPLLPVSLWGTERILPPGAIWPRPVPVTVRIGEPLDPPQASKREALQASADACATAVEALHDRGR